MKDIKDFENRIICGDCLEIMGDLPDGSIDLILTDPPYGITKEKWDVIPDWNKVGKEISRISKNGTQIMLFGMQPTFSDMVVNLSKHLIFKDEIIWFYKDGGAGNTKGTGLKNVHQNIAWFSKSNAEFIINIDDIRIDYQPNERNKYPVKRGKRIWTPNPLGAYPTNIFESPKHKEIENGITQFHKHYTIKPVNLLERLIIGFSRKNDIVLDIYSGTGSVALASANTNRRFVGIEINPDYCKIAEKRLSNIPNRLDSYESHEPRLPIKPGHGDAKEAV